jgi:uncharacterized protein Yka (UPF0111/DUF47 family)
MKLFNRFTKEFFEKRKVKKQIKFISTKQIYQQIEDLVDKEI